MNETLTREEQAELDGLNSTGLTAAEQAELDELNGVKKKQTSQPTSTSSGAPVEPSTMNGEVDFLAQANNLQPSEEQQREEQFQQTGTTGQADLKKESVKLADKQLEKNNIQTEAAKHYKAIEDNTEYPVIQELKTLLQNPEENKVRIEEIRNMPVTDDWRKAGSIQVSESQSIPVPNLKKSKFKTYGEMFDATQEAEKNFTQLQGKAQKLDAELTPAIQQKRNDAAYVPDGKDEQGNEYMKLNPMQSFVEGFGSSVDAIGLGLKKLNPLYSRDELKNDLKVKYLRDNVLFPKQAEGKIAKGTEMLGGVTPLIATGGTGATGLGALAVNALTFGTMDLGGGMYEGFAEGKSKGMSDDDAMAYADKIGLEKGATGAVLGATMPLQGAVGRKLFLNSAEAGTLKTFLAEQGVMVPSFMSKTLIDNLGAKVVGSDRDITQGVGEAGASAFIIGAMTHALATVPKLPKATKDIFENTIAKNYGSLSGVINKAVIDGAFDYSTGQRIAEKAKAFETIGKDLEPKVEEEVLPKQIEIDKLEKENEGKKGAVVEINEQKIESLNRDIKEDLGAPLNLKEQKRYDDLVAKKESKPKEGEKKEELTTSEKNELKHFEKRISVSDKKAKLAEAKAEKERIVKEKETPQEDVAEVKEEPQVDKATTDEENTQGGDGTGEVTPTSPTEAVTDNTAVNPETNVTPTATDAVTPKVESTPAETKVAETQTEPTKGKEIEPNKEVKASKTIALKEVAPEHGLKEMEAGILHGLKDKTSQEIQDIIDSEGMKGAVTKKLEEKGFLEADEDSSYLPKLTQKAKDFIEATDARLETRRQVKAGTDMFPEHANIPELQKAKDNLKQARSEAKEVRKNKDKLGVTDDPFEQAKREAEADRKVFDAYVDLIKAYGKETFNTIQDFAKELGEDVNDLMQKAWDSATSDKEPKETGITKAVMEKEWEQAGIDNPFAEQMSRDWDGTVLKEAFEKVNSGEINPTDLAKELQDNPRPTTDTENAILLIEKRKIQNKFDELIKEQDAARESGDEGTVAEINVRLAALQDRKIDNMKAVEGAGTALGRGLNSLKMAMKQDYSLVNMIAQKRAAGDGKPLSPEVEKQIRDLHQKITDTQKAYDDYVKQADERIKAAEEKAAVANIKESVEREKKQKKTYTQRGKQAAEFVRQFKNNPIELRDENGNIIDLTTMGVTWNDVVETVAKGLEGAGKLADLINDSLKDAKWYQNLSDKGKEAVRKQLTDHLTPKEETTDGKIKIPHSLIREAVEAGNEDIQGITKYVQESIKEKYPDATEREVRDAITNYGKTLNPNAEAVEVIIRKQRRIGRVVSALEDIAQKKRPLRSGLQRDKLDAEERKLNKELKEAMKELPMDSETEAKQLKTSLDAVKARLSNQIEDMSAEIEAGEKTPKSQRTIEYDAEAKALKEERDRLKAVHDDIFGKTELTDEQKIQRAEKAVERAIERVDERIKNNELESKKATPLESKKLKDERAKLAERKEVLKKLQEEAGIPEKKRLDAVKKAAIKKQQLYEDKLRKGDFSKKPTPPEVKLDAEAMKLKAAAQRAKNEFDKGLEQDRLKKRSLSEKAQDTFVKWQRAMKLSGITTLAKLTAAAMERQVITPMEEVVGGVISKAIPKVASKAEREGGLNIKAEAKALTQGFTKGLDDAWKTLTMKESDIETVFGKGHGKLPPEAADFFGHLHGALKAIPKRNEFTRSMEKRMSSQMARGVDVTDPMVQTKIAMEAYKDANRAIFMQDNAFASAFTNMMNHFEGIDKATGESKAKWAATVGRFLLPFVKVPTNIIGETLTYSAGSVTGSVKLAKAMYNGMENLKPEQADLIMRHFKKGSLGLGFLLLGYFNPQSIGGFYQKKEKRDEKDVEAGGVRMLGVDIPKYLVHNPLLEQLQIGATVRRVADTYVKKKHETKGLDEGVTAAMLGLADEVPFIKTGGMVTGAMESEHEARWFLGEMAKNSTDPLLLQDIARFMDKDEKGKTIKRKPNDKEDWGTTLWEHIETGLPFLRERVEKKK